MQSNNFPQNLSDWLAYLEQLHPQIIDLGLARIKQVAQQMHLLPVSTFVITVAGTNGKGTSVALLEQILLAAGYRVGSYTSPHLLCYNERTKINGSTVTDAALCEAFAVIEQARGEVTLTYFEFGTLAALWLFKQAVLDVIVLEVGLGGRLDAVNIVDADIALITTIALDHMEYLGNNREAIGAEKAGIMRTAKPVVCGDFEVPRSIQEYAQYLQAPLYSVGEAYNFQVVTESSWGWQSKIKEISKLPMPKMPLQNAAAVLQVLELLPTYLSVSENNIITGLQQVAVPGRFQVIPGEIPCILDVAHNPAAARWLAQKLVSLPIKGRTLAVFSMLNDKDQPGTIAAIAEQISAWYIGGLAIARGMTGDALSQFFSAAGIKALTVSETVVTAYQQAMYAAQAGDRIIIFGSFYTVAQIMQLRL